MAPRFHRAAIPLRIAAEVVIIIATIVVSVIWTAIAIAPVILSRVAIVVSTRLGTEAVYHAAASSTQAGAFAAFAIMRTRP